MPRLIAFVLCFSAASVLVAQEPVKYVVDVEDGKGIDINLRIYLHGDGSTQVGGCPHCGKSSDSPDAEPVTAARTVNELVDYYRNNPKLQYQRTDDNGQPVGESLFVVEKCSLLTIDELQAWAEERAQRLEYQAEQERRAKKEAEFASRYGYSPSGSLAKLDRNSEIARAFLMMDNLRRDRLVLNTRANGADDIWWVDEDPSTGQIRNFDTHPLRFSIYKPSFESGEQYETVKRDARLITEGGFKGATREEGWAEVCNVKFQYRSEFDNTPNRPNGNPPEGVDFTIRWTTSSSFVAAAFFPSYQKWRRHVLIGQDYFTLQGINATGVLRHEFGHLLGFRHSHIRVEAPSECPNESLENTRTLGPYDSKSVMHYLCGGAGTTHLAFSSNDKTWSRSVYGQPSQPDTGFQGPAFLLPLFSEN
ncbi:MAG TPA: hypothetical protein VMM76_12020 [Pirellulaceae bacterium]|nr:hypothetical protein [Pirellulaceae bacterium]